MVMPTPRNSAKAARQMREKTPAGNPACRAEAG
jgi:hypothetical protein